MFYVLVLASVLLFVLVAWSGRQTDQVGGNSDPDAVIAKELINAGETLTDFTKALANNSKAVIHTEQSLNNINGKLQKKGELNAEEHKKLRDIVDISKSADDQRDKIEQNLDDDDDLLDMLKKLKLQANKNHETLVEISNKLTAGCNRREDGTGTGSAATAAPLRSEDEQQQLNNEVQKTAKAIKDGCPVCPMYTETNPVNVLEVTNQGFGTIAPKTLGPNYV